MIIMNNNNVIVQIENLSFGYTDKKIIKDLALRIRKNEIVGLLGVNGSGKTTLLNLIVGLFGVNEKVSMFNKTVNLNDDNFKKRFAYITDEDTVLSYLTAKEYLNFIVDIYKLNKSDSDSKIEELIKYFKLENDYDNKLIKDFSKGMKKKIQIIGSLIYNPEFLIIDEVTNGLDIEMIYLLREILKRMMHQGTTILIASHDLNFISELCNRVLIFSEGTIKADLDMKEEKRQSIEIEFMRIIQSGVEYDSK